MISDILSAYRHDVLQADGVHSALDILALEVPQVDILVSDVRMPHNGTLLVPEVERLYPEIDIVMMTGYSDGVFKWPVLHKPFKLKVLIEAIDIALKNRAIHTVAVLTMRDAIV